jgi:hypothetical protein
MKNVIIVLLIAVLGAGIYYYLSKKQNSHSANSKELIVGKWKIDSLVIAKRPGSSSISNQGFMPLVDSSMRNFEFEFRKDSLIFQTLDKKIWDTSHYAFADIKELLIWTHTDTTKAKFYIAKLDSTQLTLKDSDSAVFYFQRIK